MPKLHPVSIEIRKGAITCKDKGGHVHGARGDQVAWSGKGGVQFTLLFEVFDGGAKAWPFMTPEPPPASWPRPDFTGTLKDEGIPRYYKYTVQVSGYDPLDPIIIVDH